MFSKQIRENLRRLDVRCAQRARWLGIHKTAERPPMEEPEEKREHLKDEIRRSFGKTDEFYRW